MDIDMDEGVGMNLGVRSEGVRSNACGSFQLHALYVLVPV